MIFTVQYTNKLGGLSEALFEPTTEEIITYFKDIKNIEVTEAQLKYISLDKLGEDQTFIDWAMSYGAEKAQKRYDTWYKNEHLPDVAKKFVEKFDINEENIDEILTENISSYCVGKTSKTSLKKKILKLLTDKEED